MVGGGGGGSHMEVVGVWILCPGSRSRVGAGGERGVCAASPDAL